MSVPRIQHTAQVPAPDLARIRTLLDEAFGGRFDDSDWHHALGGLHVYLIEADEVVAHAAVVARSLVLDGRPLRTGYLEAVAVAPARRGLGHGAAVMAESERIIRAAYELGALSSSHGIEGFYTARGWLPWQGPTAVLAPAGLTRTPDEDDSTFVLPVSDASDLRLDGLLACDWRAGDVW